MSDSVDTSALLAGFARRTTSLYAKDLRALPDSAYNSSHSGVARTPQDFTAEVAEFNSMAAGMLSGTLAPPPTPAPQGAFLERVATKQRGIEEILASGEALAQAIEGAGPRLAEMTKAPWGEPMSFAAMANLAIAHTMYHDGQITYLQALHGDAASHWSDDE